MELDKIISELKSEQDRIGKAISALLEAAGLSKAPRSPARKAVAPKRPGGMTPAGRRRLSAAMKARWAARRSSTTAPVVSKLSPAPKKRRGALTAAGRKKLSEMMKKRWAERKAKAS